MADELEQVPLTKQAFDKSNKFVRREANVSCPELNEWMEVPEGGVVIIKVRQLQLSEFMASRKEVEDYARNLIEGVMEAAATKGAVKSEVLEMWDKMPPDTKYNIELVVKGALDPPMKRGDVVFLAKMFPMVVMRLANRILDLTSQGASLKKNTNDLKPTPSSDLSSPDAVSQEDSSTK